MGTLLGTDGINNKRGHDILLFHNIKTPRMRARSDSKHLSIMASRNIYQLVIQNFGKHEHMEWGGEALPNDNSPSTLKPARQSNELAL